jgi:probable phosphoglycerate mutase
MSKRAASTSLKNPFPSAEDLKTVTEALLIRHGEQEMDIFNVRVGEIINAPLSDMGRRQAKAVGERLRSTKLDKIYSSPLDRARETADAIHKHHMHVAFQLVDDIKEFDMFAQLDQTKSLMEQLDLPAFGKAMKARNDTHSKLPLAHLSEDSDFFTARVVQAIDKILLDNIGNRIAIVAHQQVINAYLAHCFKSPMDDFLQSLHHTSITTLRAADERRNFITINDFAHCTAIQSAETDTNPLYQSKAKAAL